jgi:hypothetical protein
MDAHERAALIQRYGEAPSIIRAAVSELTEAQLDRQPPEGDGDGWSARQIVHHLADSEMTSAIRLRRLLAEDDPVIAGYDENAFAAKLHYHDRPIAPSLAALEAARATTVQLLERLTEEDWRRTGTHTEDGPYGVEHWLRTYAAHGHDHAEQIRRAVSPRGSAGTAPA